MENNNVLLLGAAAAVALFAFGGKSGNTTPPNNNNSVSKYGLTSDQADKLMQLHSVARQPFYNFIRDVQENLGWKAVVPYNPYRSFQKQQQLYNENHSNAKPGYSMHNFGMAMDLNFQKGSTVLHKGDSDQKWINSGIVGVAKKYGLFWGGDLKNYQDAVHFDLRNFYDVNKLRALAIQQFGSVQNAVGNKLILPA